MAIGKCLLRWQSFLTVKEGGGEGKGREKGEKWLVTVGAKARQGERSERTSGKVFFSSSDVSNTFSLRFPPLFSQGKKGTISLRVNCSWKMRKWVGCTLVEERGGK